MYGAPECTADLVPVDMVANSLIAVAWYTANHRREPGQVPIYNFTSGHLEQAPSWRYVGKYNLHA